MTAPGAGRGLAAVSWGVVLPAALAQSLALTLGSWGYGYHRDELYFRMLPPAWGYVDQPPLVPFLARTLSGVVDEPWALRLPATLAAALSVILVGLVTRELGAQHGEHHGQPEGLVQGRGQQDVAEHQRQGGEGVAPGGEGLCAALAVGILALGPRATLRSPWLWAGAGVAGLVALPNLAFQATHGWPQLAMGAALSENNAGEVRALALPLLLLMLGPVLAVVWGAGLVWLLRRERRAEVGFLAVAFGVLVAFTLASGAQPHYPVHLLSVVYAAGCVPVAAWLAPRTGWRRVAVAGLALNAAFSVVLALPVVPVGSVGATPLPDIGPLVADQVGWPRYVAQVADVYRSVPPGEQPVVITSNYGEAGALARFGPGLGLPRPLSGQNALYDTGRPAGGTDVVVMVGYQLRAVEQLFASCDVAARLDNGVGVDNEEQDAPVAVCRGPVAPWSELWPRFRHLD